MDDKPVPLAPPPAYPGQPAYPQSGPRPAHRPPEDPAKAEAQSKSYTEQRDLEAMLPLSAVESRVHVYRLNKHGLKDRSAPIHKILKSKMTEMNPRKDPQILRLYLLEKFGPGLYQLEPCDHHGQRLEKLASWQETVMRDGEPISENEGRYMNSREDENEYEDEGENESDSRGKRGTLPDLGSMIMEAAQQQQTTAKSGAELMQFMMMQQESARRDEREYEKKAEERREDARRRDEERVAADRKADEERKREERKQEEDRRREERKADDERRREERDREQKTNETRMAMLTGLITAGTTLVAKLLEPKPKDDSMMLKFLELTKDKSSDKMNEILIANILDKGNSKQLVEQMMAASSIVSQTQADMFKSTLKNSLEMQKEMIESTRTGGDGDGGTLDKVINLVGKAGSLFQNVLPQAGQAAPAGVAALPAPQAPQQQVKQQQRPSGVEAVVRSMIALQTGRAPDGRTLTDEDRGQVANFLIDEMPEDLGMAIINNDQGKIQAISQPAIMSNPQYIAWISRSGVLEWVGSFFDQLRPELIKIAEQQAAPQAETPPAAPQATTSPAATAEPIPGPGSAPEPQKRGKKPAKAVQAQAAQSGTPAPIPPAESQPETPAMPDGDSPV